MFTTGQEKIEGSGIKKGDVQAKRKAWDELGEYVMTKGVARYMQIIDELDNDSYLDRFENILEYFKPKLQRSTQDITTNGQSINQINITVPDLELSNQLKNYLDGTITTK